uniref:Uncharacterized protein n=1 Tax=Glossina austeni TaxID=7395 RepID=A0A1A9V4B1_GLOAU
MCRKDILMFTYLISALVHSWAAPKPFSCMSLMEDDRTLMEEDEDDSEENAASHQLDVPDLTIADFESVSNRQSIPFVPHLRVCPTDYTFCFSLWRQTENGSHIEKQGKQIAKNKVNFFIALVKSVLLKCFHKYFKRKL